MCPRNPVASGQGGQGSLAGVRRYPIPHVRRLSRCPPGTLCKTSRDQELATGAPSEPPLWAGLQQPLSPSRAAAGAQDGAWPGAWTEQADSSLPTVPRPKPQDPDRLREPRGACLRAQTTRTLPVLSAPKPRPGLSPKAAGHLVAAPPAAALWGPWRPPRRPACVLGCPVPVHAPKLPSREAVPRDSPEALREPWASRIRGSVSRRGGGLGRTGAGAGPAADPRAAAPAQPHTPALTHISPSPAPPHGGAAPAGTPAPSCSTCSASRCNHRCFLCRGLCCGTRSSWALCLDRHLCLPPGPGFVAVSVPTLDLECVTSALCMPGVVHPWVEGSPGGQVDRWTGGWVDG